VSLQSEIETVRQRVGISSRNHLCLVSVRGTGALALLDVTSPVPLFLREGQIRHTLLLDDGARPVADLQIAHVEDGYILMADGVSESELLQHLETRRNLEVPDAQVVIEGIGERFRVLGLDGPYAWELASGVLGPAVLGMPYLTVLQCERGVMCLRGGKTGEYGYDIIVPADKAATVESELEAAGKAFDAGRISLPALDHCALENWHFSPRNVRPSRLVPVLTPIELQLQWRVNFGRKYAGVAALSRRRAEPSGYRVACVTLSKCVPDGTLVLSGTQVVGEIQTLVFSQPRDEFIGTALVYQKLASPGSPGLSVVSEGESVALTVRTPPLLNNRSLFITPHRNPYANRIHESFPPLVAR